MKNIIKRLNKNTYFNLDTGSCVTNVDGIWFKISKSNSTPKEIKTIKDFLRED